MLKNRMEKKLKLQRPKLTFESKLSSRLKLSIATSFGLLLYSLIKG